MSESKLPTTLNIDSVALMNTAELRTFISDVEEMARSGGVEVEIPLEHYFSKDVYAREIKLPQGSLIVGKIHKHQNLNILSAGEVTVISVDECKRVKAPHTFVSKAGAKRIIFAHENSVWTTIHGTAETDVDKIEEQFIAKTYDEVPSIGTKETQWLG